MIIRDATLLFEQPGMLPESALKNLVEQARAVDMEKVKKEISESKAAGAAAAAS
jgi:thioredoxin 1